MTNDVRFRSFLAISLLVTVALMGAAGSVAGMAPADVPVQSARSWDHVVEVGEPVALPGYSDETTLSPLTVVSPGTTIRWVWTGTQTHTVTSGLSAVTGPDGDFDSGERHRADELENGGSKAPYTVTFDDPGVYKYYCQVHLIQHGVVIVA